MKIRICLTALLLISACAGKGHPDFDYASYSDRKIEYQRGEQYRQEVEDAHRRIEQSQPDYDRFYHDK